MDPIIALLIPIFVNMIEGCINKKPTPADVQKAAADQFDPTTGTFNQAFVEAQRPRTKYAFRKAHRHDQNIPKHPSEAELDAKTVELLTQAKDADTGTLTTAIAMANGEED